MPRRKRAFGHKKSIRWPRGVERVAELTADAPSVVVVGDRGSDIYSRFARRLAGVYLIVRAAQNRALVADAPLFASAAAWPELRQMPVKVAPRRMGTIRDHGSSIHNRRSHSGQDKCQNPVAQREGEPP